MKVPRRGLHHWLILMLGGENPSELAQGLLVTLIGDLSKVAGKLQTHPLPRADRAVVFLVQPIEKVIDRYAEDLSDLEQSAGRHAIDAAFVFVGLLISYTNKVSELLLGQAEHDPAFADAGSDITVDVLSPARRSA